MYRCRQVPIVRRTVTQQADELYKFTTASMFLYSTIQSVRTRVMAQQNRK